MSRPSAYPTWATNANFSTGPDVGTPTKSAIPAGRRADGWVKDVAPPPQYQNQWQSEVDAWVEYLDARDATMSVGGSSTVINSVAASYTQFASYTFSNLKVGDIVGAQFFGSAQCQSPYNIDAWITENGGAEVLVTPGSGVGNYAATGTDTHPIMLSFAYTVTVAGSFAIHLKSRTSNIANALTIYNSSSIRKVYRFG